MKRKLTLVVAFLLLIVSAGFSHGRAYDLLQQQLNGASQPQLGVVTTEKNQDQTVQMPIGKIQPKELNAQTEISDFAKAIKGTRWTESKGNATSRSKVAKKSKYADGTVLGDYAERDLITSSKNYRYSMTKFEVTKNDTVQICNFYGLGDTIKAVATDANTLLIKPQFVYTYSSIDFYCCPVDLENKVFYSDKDIVATINADGTITLPSWGLFAIDAANSGKTLVALDATVFLKANTVITNNSVDGKVETYSAYTTQTKDDELTIINFAGNGTPVTVNLNSDKTAEVYPQYIAATSLYGDLFCYAMKVNGTSVARLSTPIEITGTDKTMTLGCWGVCTRMGGNLLAMCNTSSEITFEKEIKYPAKIEVNFEGSGTEASPYLIKSVADFAMMAQSVNSGTTYEGQYFKLAADVDFATSTSSYKKIGKDMDNPFEGTFDGEGYTIKNFNYKTGEVDYYGLFGVVGAKGCVKNVTMEGVQIDSYSRYSGAIAGEAVGSIKNCNVKGNLMFRNVIGGGIVGYVDIPSTVDNCTFAGTIQGSGDNGAIVGALHGRMTNCHSDATLIMRQVLNTLYRSVGGLVGSTIGKQDTDGGYLSDSYFYGMVDDESGYAYSGGVSGEIINGKMERCFNAGVMRGYTTVSSDGTVSGSAGGLLGIIYGGRVKDCYSSSTFVGYFTTNKAGCLIGNVLKPMSDGSMKSYVESTYGSGSVVMPILSDTIGIAGLKGNPDAFTNVYFDKQTSGMEGEGAKLTSELTSGQALEGFSADVWQFTEGQYPTLKGINDNEAARLSATPILLTNKESIKKIKSDFKVSTANGVTWKFYVDGALVDEGDGLKIEGSDVKMKGVYAKDMIYGLSESQKYFKVYQLTTIPNGTFEGDGTEESPYIIRDKEDMILLQTATTEKEQSYEGDFFKMANDIDMTDATEFKGVAYDGNTKHVFSGTFDGDGHTFHNLKINNVTYDDGGKAQVSAANQYGGIFGRCGAKSVIKNLNVAEDCEFMFTGISGVFAGQTEGVIENCRNYANVTGVSTYISGIAARVLATGSVIDCYNAGKITTGSSYVAGIVGNNAGLVQNCQNDGEISGEFVNILTADGRQAYAAGIVSSNSGKVNTCLNQGHVHAFKTVGGIVNTMASASDTLRNCVNTGYVELLSEAATDRGAILSAATSKLFNNYYDKQINCNGASNGLVANGCYGMTTAELTSGKAVEKLDAEAFAFEAGHYPVLKKFADEPKSKALSSMYVKFDGKQNRSNIKSDAELSSPEGIAWTLLHGTSFAVNGNAMKVTIPEGKEAVSDTLYATLGDCKKMIPLKVVPKLFKGNGTEEDPYLIETIDDMTSLAGYVNEDLSFTGEYFKLVNDLDYKDKEYTVVGLGVKEFDAVFDGNQKTFDNIAITAPTKSPRYALFGNVGENGAILNLTAKGTMAGDTEAGGIVGYLSGKVDNCKNYMNVSAPNGSYAAGIVAVANPGASISNCENYGEISAKTSYVAGIVAKSGINTKISDCKNAGTTKAGTSTVAGIAAMTYCPVTNCENTAEISSSKTVAGIVAYAHDGTTIEGCKNTANITGTGTTVGGVLGESVAKERVILKDCSNTGEIKGTGTIGGVFAKGGAGMTVENCNNSGTVTATSSSNVGGLGGSIAYYDAFDNYVANCYNTGDVVSSATSSAYAGGLIGYVYADVKVSNCYNTGNVDAVGNFVGGFSGCFSAEGVNCYNTGDVTSSGYGIGGFSGIGSGTITKCFNTGNVESTQSKGNTGRYGTVGGIWGYGACTIIDSYNMGTLTSPDFLGGINGFMFNNAAITNSFSAGKIVTPETATMVGNVAQNTTNTYTITNAYFDKTLNGGVGCDMDANGTGLTTKEFTELNIDDNFVNNVACYPVLKDYADNEVANFYSVTLVLADGDTYDNVLHSMKIGTAEGTTWTCTPNLEINGNDVVSLATGEATLTATCGDRVKKFNLVINAVTGIDGVTSGKVCVAKKYFNVNGVQLNEKPLEDGVYVVEMTYDDGTKEVKKVVIRQ